MAAFVVFFTTYALVMPATTASAQAYCGIEEHTHSDACYEDVLICGMEENDSHKHDASCYEKQLACGKEEHKHDLLCYSDEKADVETTEVWEATLPEDKDLTGVPAEDLVAIARSQIGYEESTDNYDVAEDGKTIKGYTRYGTWNDEPYVDWSMDFVAFCLSYAGIGSEKFPVDTEDQAKWIEALEKADLIKDISVEDYTVGDIVFLKSEENGESAVPHMGIISAVDKKTIKVIEGDAKKDKTTDAVLETEYKISSDKIVTAAELPGAHSDVTAAEEAGADGSEAAEEVDALEEAETAENDTDASDDETTDDSDDATDAVETDADAEASEDGTETVTDGANASVEDAAEQTTLSYQGDDYLVTATFGPNAGIVQGTELTVSEIYQDGKFKEKRLYKKYLNQSEDILKKEVSKNTDIKSARFFDITFENEGNEIEPTGNVKITITTDEAAGESVSAIHLPKGEEAQMLDVVADGNDISFVADSFSVYGVIYTVDFTWEVDGKTYDFTMDGEDAVSLRALIETLHVYEKSSDKDNPTLDEFMSEIESVEFSDPELLVVCEVKADSTLGALNIANGIVQDYTLTAPEPELKEHNAKEFKAGDWALISLKPFDTEETLKIRLASGEEFTINVTDEQDAQMVGDQVLTVSNPAGTTIDLFDYWISDDLRYTVGRAAWPGGYNGSAWTNDWTYQDIGLQVEGQGTEAGINEGHAFKFTPAYAGTVRDGTTNYKNEDASGRINSYTGSEAMGWFCPDPNQGIVQNTLSGGYPVLTNNSAKGTNGESLAYLFDPTISHEGKESYSGVDQFLYVDKDGYYKYDSRDYKADYNNDGTFTLTEQTAEGSDRGFWPFGTSTYWSGMHINAQFSQPENGQVLNPRGKYKDMQFEFSGDDDTWIYVDGVLIGDGGGIHNRTEIDINFATGKVIINGEEVGTLKEMIESAKSAEINAMTPEEKEKWDAQWSGDTFAAGTYHTFDMFYLERGGDQSNLYIKYNLISTADFTAHKSYTGYDDDDVMQRNQFRFELIGLDGKYRSVLDPSTNDYVLVQEDTTSEAIMPHASSSGAGTTVSPYYSDDYRVELHDGTTVNSQIYITGNVEDGNVNFGNAQISEQDMHDCDAGNPPVYRYIVREAVPDDAVNADNITWANATPEQRAAGGFVKDSVVYDNTVYYMAARVTSWTETDASGTSRTRYGLSKTYYTDDTYTTKKENTPFIDFRNTYKPDLASFAFDKVDANREPVKDAVFQLFRDSACKIPAKDSNNQTVTAVSGADGKVHFTDVRTGIYFMKEVSAPDPYDLNPTVYRVTISKQGSHMCVNSDQNNTPVTEVYNLKSTDITVIKKWVNKDGVEVSGEGHPATVQLRRYHYVSTAPAPETHTVTLHFHFPYADWNTPNKDFGPYTVTGNSVNIHWSVGGCDFFWDSGYTQAIATGDCLIQMPLTNDIELDIYGNRDWASNTLNDVSVDGAFLDSKELRPDDTFPSEDEKSKANQRLTEDHPMHAWSFGVGEGFDFPLGDELGQYYYYLVELDSEGNEVAIDGEAGEGMTLKSIVYSPEKTDGYGITHGLITVTNQLAAPKTTEIEILKTDNENNSINYLEGAVFTLAYRQNSEGTWSQAAGIENLVIPELNSNSQFTVPKTGITLTGLIDGQYRIEENIPPGGYVITQKYPVIFTVVNGEIQNTDGTIDSVRYRPATDVVNAQFIIPNTPGAELPHTGGHGTLAYTLLGLIIIAGAGSLLWSNRRRKTIGR